MKERMFAAYPDVVNVDQLREMLGGIGYKSHMVCCTMAAFAFSR